MEEKLFHFTEGSLEKQLSTFASKGITQLEVRDISICADKKRLLQFLQLAVSKAPDVFFDFYLISASSFIAVIDNEIIEAFSQLFCAIHIPLPLPAYKKSFSKKISCLNNAGLVFGFELDSAHYTSFACAENKPENKDTPFSGIRLFCDMLDFAIGLYPNDIVINSSELKATAQLSTQDIKKINRLSFAVYTFYSAGRAVPWFCTAIQALRIKPSKFFEDFSEWLYCNNASAKDFKPDVVPHKELEKMQLIFLQLKYEEKKLQQVFPVLKDLIQIHGAFSRVSANEQDEEILEVSYNPDDVLSAFAMNLVAFADEVCMEQTTVRIFATAEGPEYEIASR